MSGQLPFHFESREPAPHLAPAVERLWYAFGTAGYGEEAILPNGRTVLLVNLGDPFAMTCAGGASEHLSTAWLCGPQTRFIVNRPLGITHMLGATLRPLGAACLFAEPVCAFTDRAILLEDVWGAAARALRDRLGAARSVSARFDLLERHLIGMMTARPRHDALCRYAVQRLSAATPKRVGELCAELEISRKHLGHLLRTRGGLAPSTVARLARFNRFLDTLWSRPDLDFAQAADLCGYYDQPHMNRDFLELSGTSPSAYMHRLKHKFAAQADAADNRHFVPQTR
jgi:AraC-like DNA-binding protein